MTKLAQTQKIFQDHILNNATAAIHSIHLPPQGTKESRLAVYREGYYLRLIEIISGDFETLFKELGDIRFNQLARAYITITPPCCFSLDEYAASFPDFIKTHTSRFYYEIAHFEWAIAMMRLVKPDAFLNESALRHMPAEKWPHIAFSLQPHVSTHRYEYDVIGLYEKEEVNHPSEPSFILIWQKNHFPYYMSLSKEKKVLIELIQSGCVFSTMCEQLCEYLSEEEVPNYVATTLKELIENELLVNYFIQS
jgi:hypothetical protein